MNIQITLARYDEAEEMAEIHCKSWKYAYKGIIDDEFIQKKNSTRLDMWKNILSKENTIHYIVRYGKIAIGMVSACLPRDCDLDETTYEIMGIYFLPYYIGKGYGSETMKYFISKIKDLGYKKISLWVLKDNYKARKFYEKCGFVFDGTEESIVYGKILPAVRYINVINT